MRSFLFAPLLLASFAAHAGKPWNWSLVPSAARFTLDGVEAPAGSWSSTLTTDSTGLLDLLLLFGADHRSSLQLRSVEAQDDRGFQVEAEIIAHGIASSVLLNVQVLRSRDVNGQELLHVVAMDIPQAPDERTGSGPHPSMVAYSPRFQLDAWFVLTDPTTPFIRFCNSDD